MKNIAIVILASLLLYCGNTYANTLQTGLYDGRLDGRRIKMKIGVLKSKGTQSLYQIEIQDLSYSTTYTGELGWLIQRKPKGHFQNLRLRQKGGNRQMTINQFIVHFWDNDYVSCVINGNQAAVFVHASDQSKLTSCRGANLQKSNLTATSLNHLLGTYKGVLDGVPMTFTISSPGNNRFGTPQVSLILTKNNYRATARIEALDPGSSGKIQILNQALKYANGKTARTIKRLTLHTRNTCYLSGYSQNGNRLEGWFFHKVR